MKKLLTIAAVTSSLLLGACADSPYHDTGVGAVLGGVAGAVIGKQVGGERGTYIGGAVGALAGGSAGKYMDDQRMSAQQQLAAEQARNEVNITQLPDQSTKIDVAADVTFDSGSATLRPGAMNTYAKIAANLKQYPNTVIHVVGHTDSDGADDYNQGLSERRAASVANFLIGQGVDPSRIRQEGRGEREPIASNATEDGKRRNRRVDIVVKPIIQGQEQSAYQSPGYLGS